MRRYVEESNVNKGWLIISPELPALEFCNFNMWILYLFCEVFTKGFYFLWRGYKWHCAFNVTSYMFILSDGSVVIFVRYLVSWTWCCWTHFISYVFLCRFIGVVTIMSMWSTNDHSFKFFLSYLRVFYFFLLFALVRTPSAILNKRADIFIFS